MRFLAFLPILFFAPALLDGSVRPSDTIVEGEWKYRELEIEGWTVFVQKELYAKTELRTKVLDLMKIKLWEIATRLPG